MHSSYPEPKNNGVNSTEIAKIPHAIAEETATISSIDNKTFTYEEIENIVWGGALMSQSAIRSVVRDLRKKIGEKYIINVSGIGYRLK